MMTEYERGLLKRLSLFPERVEKFHQFTTQIVPQFSSKAISVRIKKWGIHHLEVKIPLKRKSLHVRKIKANAKYP